MKQIIFVLLAILLLANPLTVIAQTKSTPTPEPTETDSLEQIQRIKDIVASKVAELNLVEKRGIMGTVQERSNTQITLIDDEENTRIIDIDELTKFEGEEEFGISDINENEKLTVVGLYNIDTERLLARVVTRPNAIPTYFSGVVTEINEDDFQIIAVNEKDITITIDVEKSTVTSSYAAGEELEKSGFSRIEVGQRILVAGYPDPQDEKILNASRITHFIDIPPSTKMKVYGKINDEPDNTTLTSTPSTSEDN